MSELPTGVVAIVVYAIIALVAVVFLCFMLFPKRTKRTVEYMLVAFHEYKEAKKGEPNAKIELPDLETKKPFKAVPDPRIEKEPEL